MSYTNTYAGVDGVVLKAADADDQFTLIETALAAIEGNISSNILPFDGTSSIIYGTNWGDLAGGTSCVNFLGTGGYTIAALNIAVKASGAPGATLLTLPAGLRPFVVVKGIAGRFYDASAAANVVAYGQISTGGAFTLVDANNSALTLGVNDEAFFNVVYPYAN